MAKYDHDFKKEIAELVHNKIKSRAEIKREYRIAPSTVVGWEKQFFGEGWSFSSRIRNNKTKKVVKRKRRRSWYLKKLQLYSRET